MEKNLLIQENRGKIWFSCESMITLEKFTSIESRISSKKPELMVDKLNWKKKFGQENFDKYINIIQNINADEKSLLI